MGLFKWQIKHPTCRFDQDKAVIELQKFNLNEDIFIDYFKIIDECEFARFAPSQEARIWKSLYDYAADVISKMGQV